MNTVEERLARYRYELEATTEAEHTDDVRPVGNPRPDGRRALVLLTAAALVVVGLVVLNNRSIGNTPAGSQDSSVPTNDGTAPTATAAVDGATTTYTLDPKVNEGQTPEQWYPEADPQDTLAAIATRFGVGAGAIAVWNGWTEGEAHVLTPGSTVRIPPGGTIVPNAVVPYGSLQVTPNDKPVLVGATNDLKGVCLLTSTQIAGCDTVELPTPPVVARAQANANAPTVLIYGIADAGREVTIEDRAGTTIGQAVMSPAYQGRRAFAVLVPKTADSHYKVVQTQPDGTQFWVPIIL